MMSWFIAGLLGVGLVVLAWKFASAQRRLLSQDRHLHELQAEKKVFFDFLHDLGESLSTERGQSHMLRTILSCCAKVTNSTCGAIYLLDEAQRHLVAKASIGNFPPPVTLNAELEERLKNDPEYLHLILRNEPVPLSQSNHLLVQACEQGHSIWLSNVEDDKRWPRASMEWLRLQSIIVVPFKFQGETLGVLALANPTAEHQYTLSGFEVLKSVCAQASFALHHSNVFTQLAEKQLMDRDVETARQVQSIMLPRTPPPMQGYELSATNIPAQRLSGDYYDFFTLDQHRIGMVIADVSGKGMAASIIMAMCRTAMRSEALSSPSPSEVLRRVNNILCPDMSEDMFITMLYVVLDRKNHTLTIARAGHDAPLLFSQSTQSVRSLQSPGMGVGIDTGEIFDDVLQDLIVPLEVGDTLLVYTDGIPETSNAQGLEFGHEPIQATLQSHAIEGTQSVLDQVIERARDYRGNEPQADDITLMALKRI